MLLGMDEYPYHQITETFAGVAGSDPQWNDGHYICLCDRDGKVSLTSNVRLYQNNDVLDGFVCLRHQGRQHRPGEATHREPGGRRQAGHGRKLEEPHGVPLGCT